MKALLINSGRLKYEEAWNIQKILHRLRVDGKIPDTLWLLEHEPVITLGRKASMEHLLVEESYLKKLNIELFHVERGGDITYHGPGQLIGYLFFKLKDMTSVRPFVRKVEQAIVHALKLLQVEAKTEEGYTGVWIGRNKICAIGIAVRDWVTFHGFALYVDPIKEHFNLIVPCGIKDRGIISLSDILPNVSMDDVRKAVAKAFEHVFNLHFETKHLDSILNKEEFA